MKLLMVSGDRSILQGKLSAFWYTLQEMRKHWDRIDVICPRVADKDVGISESGHRFDQHQGGGEVFFHPNPAAYFWQSQWIVKRGQHLIAEHGHQVMTVHDYPPFYHGIGAKRLHKRTNIPYAIEIHHIVGWPKAGSIQEWIGKWMTRCYIAHDVKRAAAVRVVNNVVADKLPKWGVPAHKTHNISSLYLDADILSPNNRPPIAYDVSFCGRLVANKGLSNVIKAIAKLPGIRLLVIGDGPERDNCERLAARLGVSNRITFVGWLPNQESVMQAVMTARVFVMNSTSEGGPRIALEAMGCGMPIVTTKVGIMPDIVRNGVNGLFTTGKPDDLAAKISGLLDNEELQDSMGKVARHVLDQFERGKLITAYAEFLKGLV